MNIATQDQIKNAMKEAEEFVVNNPHYQANKDAAKWAVTEFILFKQGVSCRVNGKKK